MDPTGITHLAFDADDTLWANENIFVDAKERCLEVLRPYLGRGKRLEEELYRFERRNLSLFGYGVKGFMLSMVETAIELSSGRVTGREIQRLVDVGKEMLAHPVELLPGVAAAIDRLEDRYTLMVITKGDLFDQENKLARSGLADRFAIVEIVSEKDAATYRAVLRRHAIDPANFFMIGNSLKSDVLPILEIGGRAAHLPYAHTWLHERVAAGTRVRREWWEPESMEAFVAEMIRGG